MIYHRVNLVNGAHTHYQILYTEQGFFIESVFVTDNATFDIGDINGAYESYTAGWAKIIDLDSGDIESVD